MITLYHFGPFQDLPDPSPFCLKVDAYLRMTRIEFKCIATPANLRIAPKGKLPFIEDNGKIIADSTFIIEYLKKTYGDALDSHLDQRDRAISHAFIKLMDENLYWCLVHSRWVDEKVWPVVKQSLFGKLSFPLRQLIPVMARRGVKKALYLQGTGRHTHEEILEIARRDLDALSALLGDKHYFMGDKATTLDAVAYGFLAEAIFPQLESPLNALTKSYANLVAFCERIRKKYYTT